jgi:hypothetical protein
LCNHNSNKNKGQFSSNSKTDLLKKKSRKFEHTESTIESVFNETETSSEDNAKLEQRTKNKHKHHEEIMGEFKNIKPPIFNGEIETGEEA